MSPSSIAALQHAAPLPPHPYISTKMPEARSGYANTHGACGLTSSLVIAPFTYLFIVYRTLGCQPCVLGWSGLKD